MNYTQWNIVVQHPNSDNLTQLFSFKSLTPYDGLSELLLLDIYLSASVFLFPC